MIESDFETIARQQQELERLREIPRLIASAIREVVENDQHPNPKTIAESIALTLRAQDSTFDVGRFMVETGTLAREWAT
jgi:hypothetical protein